MSDFLKGNYKVEKKIVERDKAKKNMEAEFREKAINSIGGSMVFVERSKMVWDGKDEEK